MARTYEDVVTARRSRLGSEARGAARVFEEAYTVAMQIVELREQHRLTQAQLAERSGVDQADISRIERGSTNPTAKTLQRIADALDADLRLVARS